MIFFYQFYASDRTLKLTLMLVGNVSNVFIPIMQFGAIALPPSNTCLARELFHIFRFEKLCHPRQGMPTSRTSALQEEPSYSQKMKR